MCETEGTVDYVKYYLDNEDVKTHYSAPFYINGDNSGTYINKFDYLSETCGSFEITVKAFTWADGDESPCQTTVLALESAPEFIPLTRCHLCRACNKLFMQVPLPRDNLPPKAQYKVERAGEIVVERTRDVILRDYTAWHAIMWWNDWKDASPDARGSAVYMRTDNTCAEWIRCSIGSPIALDLDRSEAVERISGDFAFDLSGDGVSESLNEWFAPSEGILVDSTYPGFESGQLSGWHLYGDLGGQYDSGFEKLALHDFNGDGVVSDSELEGIAIWRDTNSNAKLDDGELSSLETNGVVSLSLSHDEHFISTATVDNGSEEYTIITEDLWFSR